MTRPKPQSRLVGKYWVQLVGVQIETQMAIGGHGMESLLNGFPLFLTDSQSFINSILQPHKSPLLTGIQHVLTSLLTLLNGFSKKRPLDMI